jgi:hypothetical protein
MDGRTYVLDSGNSRIVAFPTPRGGGQRLSHSSGAAANGPPRKQHP